LSALGYATLCRVAPGSSEAGVTQTARKWRHALTLALALVTCVDLVRALENPFMHPAQSLSVLDADHAVLAFLKRNQDLGRTYIHEPSHESPRVMEKQGTLQEIYSITDYEPLSLSRTKEFFRVMDPPRSVAQMLSTFTGSLTADPTRSSFGLLRLLSVRYVVVGRADARFREAILGRGWSLALAPRSSRYVVYEAPDFLPRAYVVPNVRLARDSAEALSMVSSPAFDPTSTAVLEGERDAPSSAPLVGASARIAEYAPTRVSVEVQTPEPAHLVLTDTYFPGWRADIDGEPVTIRRANYLFRSVLVPSGTHRVTFEYRPLSFVLGAWVTLASASILALVLIFPRLVARAQSARERA